MIVKMKKICLMVQDKSRVAALKKLRAAGVVHLERRDAPLDANSNALRRKAKVEESLGLIQDYKVPKKKKGAVDPNDTRAGWERRQKPVGMHRGRRATDVFGTDDEAPYSLDAIRAPARPYLPELMAGFGEEKKVLKEQDFFLSREVSRLEGWGDFDPAEIEEVSKCIPVYLYEMSPDLFSKLDKNVQFIKVKSDKSIVRIVVFSEKITGMNPVVMPEKRLSEFAKLMDDNKKELQEIDDKLKSYADRRPALNKEMLKVEYELEFETAVAGMSKVDDIPEDLGVCWLTGYVPCSDVEGIKNVACENGWAYSLEDPLTTDERVPTKLKNNGFVDLLKPITGFLEIMPGYKEYDISPFFLFFFCIFFSMIYGDAGYGLILTSLAITGFVLMSVKKKKIPLAFPMLFLLGTCNMIWGALTCSWFGMPLDVLPDFFKDISLSYISTAKSSQDVVNQNLQIFCFSLGLVHLSVAHLINMFRCKSLRMLGELGNIAMLTGMYNVVLMLIVSNETRTIEMWPFTIQLIAAGWFLNFLFGAYVTSMGQAIKSSLGNIMSVLLGVVNIFSDIMSYIRLWAVGLAGAAIAGTVNVLAGPMLGGFLIFAGLILLVFGHGMNMVLNVLSVLVHGVRLNTLEFSGHVGLTWSGTAYKPFAEKDIK